jgi:hypothetical protein
MFSFKKSLLGLIGLLVLVGGLAAVSRGQGNNPIVKQLQPRKYYLTDAQAYNGSQALTACASGYHMASLWEIFDTSNLIYNTELGWTSPDSGFGPPTAAGADGWIRTGGESSISFTPGQGSCNAYTSANSDHGGTTARLFSNWESSAVTVVSPWRANGTQCGLALRVWCVQD